MSGFLGNNYFIHSHGPTDSHLDRGLYSSGNNMYGNPPSTNDQLAQFSFSMFFRNDYSISTTSACAFNVFNAGANDFGGVGFKGNGDFVYYVKYNYSVYHNLGSGSGTGGTQSAGGTYPGSSGGGACSGGNSLCAGYKLRGGQSCGNSPGASSGTQGWPQQIYGGNWGAAAGGGGCNGGGGGAGYYGGSGAGHTTATYGNSGCGGGGSGYTGGSGSYTTSNVGTHNGNQHNVSSQATNSGYLTSGVNVGGVYNTDVGNGNHAGGNGKVVLYYLAPT